jgi:hypothetical protein
MMNFRPIVCKFMKGTFGVLAVTLPLAAQDASKVTKDTAGTHFAAAKAAAGDDFQNLYEFQCNGPGPRNP